MTATNKAQYKEALNNSNWKTNNSLGRICGKEGGKPPVATVVKLLAIYNMPKVAINEGIPNLSFI